MTRGHIPGGSCDCSACKGLTAATPRVVANRPGLPAIGYRVGEHADFKRSMLAGLSGGEREALARLNTRDDDDFSIALLDAWAVVADVLTFYQERIANEGYLRTAGERFSVVELVRSLGYELAPGVAASAYLSFELEDAPGFGTIAPGVKVQSIPGPGERPQTFETVEEVETRAAWNRLGPRLTRPQAISPRMSSLVLEGSDLNLRPGDRLLIGDGSEVALRTVGKSDADFAAQQTTVTLQPDDLEPRKLELRGVWAMRVRSGPFGHTAALEARYRDTGVFDGFGEWNLARLDRLPTADDGTPDVDRIKLPADGDPKEIYLDALLDEVESDLRVVVIEAQDPKRGTPDRLFTNIAGARTMSRADYGLTSRVTHITLGDAWRDLPGANVQTLEPFRLTTVYAGAQRLTPAEVPDTSPLSGDTIVLQTVVEGLEAGRKLLFAGQRDGIEPRELVGEVVTLAEAPTSTGTRTTLVLTEPLRNAYDRASLVIHGNIVRSTHGETKAEVLGSADGSIANQRFSLREPVTYVPAETPSGAASTLRVYVNDLLWSEAPTLYGRGPREHVYTATQAEDGKVTLQFGDGKNGARPPAGNENVRAVYRTGTGREGQVRANQLSLLMTRPLGVRAAVNPLPASGAEDPEKTEDVRRNAPLSVLTLDRIVSLQDFTDFALSFGGIARALATWTWAGQRRGVLVTVAGVQGDAVPDGSDLQRRLQQAICDAGDPLLHVQVKSYTPVRFGLAAKLRVDPAREPDRVLAAVRAELGRSFSFEQRTFGQGVALSELVAVVHRVPGVVAVDVDQLYRSSGPGLAQRLDALIPAPASPATTVQPAELLTLDPSTLIRVELTQ